MDNENIIKTIINIMKNFNLLTNNTSFPLKFNYTTIYEKLEKVTELLFGHTFPIYLI